MSVAVIVNFILEGSFLSWNYLANQLLE